MLLVRDGQEDTIIQRQPKRVKRVAAFCSGDGDVPGITAQSGPAGFATDAVPSPG